MRTILYAMMMSLALHGCGTRSAPDETGSAPSPGTASAGGCYQRVEGRDTTFLRLDEDGPAVTGELRCCRLRKTRPGGPSAAPGLAARSGPTGNGPARALPEPYEVVFTLSGDTVTWWEGERVRREGKWVLKEPGAGYQYVMVRSACP
jgi:hypothetical protein